MLHDEYLQNGMTALTFAIQQGHKDIANNLIKKKADLSITDKVWWCYRYDCMCGSLYIIVDITLLFCAYRQQDGVHYSLLSNKATLT